MRVLGKQTEHREAEQRLSKAQMYFLYFEMAIKLRLLFLPQPDHIRPSPKSHKCMLYPKGNLFQIKAMCKPRAFKQKGWPQHENDVSLRHRLAAMTYISKDRSVGIVLLQISWNTASQEYTWHLELYYSFMIIATVTNMTEGLELFQKMCPALLSYI